MTDKEKRAHDLAVILCQQDCMHSNGTECDQGKVFDYVKMYEHYYTYVLKSFEIF